MSSVTVNTTPFGDQKPGTSGLRKKVTVFTQPHYTENFVQSILLAIPPADGTPRSLVVCGDGRYYMVECIQLIIKLAVANAQRTGVTRIIVPVNGVGSTPAASHLIRTRKSIGGILLTASHNPGGPTRDFGIKYNVSNGGPAPESVTDAIFATSKTLTSYAIASDLPDVDLSRVGAQTLKTDAGEFVVDVIDAVTPYIALLKSIFDFDAIKEYVHSAGVSVLFDGMSGVTGPFARALFVSELGLPESVLLNCEPSPTFNDGHPDPNLTYAHELVELVEKNSITFGAASDGDGDRNMIYGAGAFVSPSDSVAVIADWADAIPYFKGGVKGLARSMPTSGALDRVAAAKKLEFFEVPTGWKFFGNLMDAGRLSICGEESFGTGSDHIREKDGLWAVAAWLNILAAAARKGINGGIGAVLQDHYTKYGRTFFSRYDYEEVASDAAGKVMAHIEGLFADPAFKTQKWDSFSVAHCENFTYTDPIDHSVSKNQGLIVVFADGSRIVWRLSGTGSSGATIRMYVEKYSSDPSEYALDTAKGLKPLIDVALRISKLEEFTGRKEPTVIT